MAGGISINILSNVREAVRGVDDVADAVDEAGDRLRDLTKEGDTAADRMEDDFRSVAKSADRNADILRDKFRAAYRDVRASSDDTADAVVRSQRRMGERSQEVGQEIRQNLGEGIANAARGDFASLADTIGDTFGGAVAGIGGIATAGVAAAGALGIGALVAAFTTAEEKRKELEDRANDLAQAYIEAGSNVLGAMAIASRTNEILTGDERQKALDYAQALGVDIPTAARAMAGDLNALAVVNQIASDAQEKNTAIVGENASALEKARGAQSATVQENQKQIDAANELNGVIDGANAKFKEQQEVLKGLIKDAEGATRQVDDLGNAVYTLPDGTQILIDAETGQATTDVSKFKGDLGGVPEEVNTRVKVSVDAREWENWQPNPKTGRVNARATGGRFWE